jgi:agmatine deiminase
MLGRFFHVKPAIYPVWRQRVHPALHALRNPILRRFFPLDADQYPPPDAQAMARLLVDWGLSTVTDLDALAQAIERVTVTIATVDPTQTPASYTGDPLRIPAQWEATGRVLLSWGRMYPQVYPMHAQLVEAIAPVAQVDILVPSAVWARGIAVYLAQRGRVALDRLRFLVLRTDDIWIRDYGPIVGIAPDGQRVAVNATYDVLPHYPQQDDDRMPLRWAAHQGLPVLPLALSTEGGNLWSDGAGTLLMSAQVFFSNPYYTRATLTDYLHTVFDFEQLLITPRLLLEETGHIDLLVKLASPTLVFVSAATSFSTQGALLKNKRLFQRATNAQGDRYHVVELPTPPLYLNQFTYTIRRSYTNALTVNGRVLVPTYGIADDEIALRRYQDHLPDYEIIPIDSAQGILGGGAVHCMTKEVPQA